MKKLLLITGLLLLAIQQTNAQDLYAEDFESSTNGSLPVGWQSSADPGAVWKTGMLLDMMAPGCMNGFEHTRYAGLKVDTAYQAVGRTDILTLPPIPLQSTTTYNLMTLQADIFYNGINDTCELQASYNNGNTWAHIQYLTPVFWEPGFYILPAINNTSTLLLRFVHKTAAGGTYCGVYIDNIHLYMPQSTDASVYTITPLADSIHNYGAPAQGATVKATVINRGLSQLQNFTVKYKLGNGAVQSQPVTGFNLAWGEKGTVTFTAPCTVPVSGTSPLKVWVEAMGDGDNTNDTFNSTMLGAAFMPVKKPVMEERGGTWCGWCVRGLYYCDSLKEVHENDATIINVHNADPMAINAYDNYMAYLKIDGFNMAFYGFPIIAYDRRKIEDPQNIFAYYNKFKEYFGYGDIELGNAVIDNNNLSIKVDFKPAIDMTGTYKLGFLLTEDSVHNLLPGYIQWNAYSYMAGNIPFFGYESLPNNIPAEDMYYNHVARVFEDNYSGTPNSLPTQMTAGNIYSHTFNTTLDTSWHMPHLNAVALLIRGTDTFILNSNHRKLVETLDVNAAVENGKDEMLVYPNPASNVVYVSYAAQKAGNVTLKLIDMMGRVVYCKNYGTVAADKQSFTVPVNGLPAGIYNLQLETGTGTTSKKINNLQ